MTPPERRRLAALLPPLALGLLAVLAFAPLGWFPLAWVSLGGLFVLLRRAASPGAGFRDGFLWGLGLFGAGVSWVFVSMHDFGGMPAPLALLATLLFCAGLALFPAAVGTLFVRWRGSGFAAAAGLFAGLWTLAEWLRATLFSGFPWLSIGYSQVPPLAGLAPVLGVFGLSFAGALLAAVLAEWLLRFLGVGSRACAAGRGRLACSAPPLLFAGLLLAAADLLREVRWTEAAGPPLRVALLQGNVPQDLKWRPERLLDSMETYYRLARDHPAKLTILPETALPAMFSFLPREYVADLEALARARGGDLLLGSVIGEARRYTNSVVSIGSSPRQSYAKRHLVPFGEFVPPGFAWFIGLMDIPMSGFTAGAAGQPPLEVGGQRLAINICYEDVFGDEIAAALGDAAILVNVSNTAWFGRSWAQLQHLQIAQLRALETGRPMLRATNTGMTAHLTPDGRIAAVLEPFTRAALVVDAQGMRGTTPFMRWGNGAALLLALLAAAFGVWRGRAGANAAPGSLS